MEEGPWAAPPNGIVPTVRLTPNGVRDAIEGIERLANSRSALEVRVRAPPMDGAANAALIALIATATGVTKRDVSLVAGLSARVKPLKVAGTPAALCTTLEQICASGSRSR